MGQLTANQTSAESEELFLGLDSSTQGLKCVVMSATGAVVHEEGLNFDRDLSWYKTQSGCYAEADGLTVTAPSIMFAEALDMLLGRIQAKAPQVLAKVAAVSASGQQHGSVYWGKGARGTLKALLPSSSLKDQLKDSFSRNNGPIWRDSSTGADCEAMERECGGAQGVADITGSRAYERFTGSQIRKMARTSPQILDKTERISLVSSMLASLMLGDYAPIDGSDACGMNLMDLRGMAWSPTLLASCFPGRSAQELETKLGPVAWSHQVCGQVSSYFVSKYGLNPKCVVVASTGDNPSTIAGLQVEKAGEVVVSMGTSDTVLAVVPLDQCKPSGEEGNILRNPIDPNTCMAMLCYKNGSVTREKVRKNAALETWDAFNAALTNTPAGSHGHLAYHYKEAEITPRFNSTAVFRFDANDRPLAAFPNQGIEARSAIEGQFMSMRLHVKNLGLTSISKVIATGGASVNPALLQVMASVFNCPVYVSDAGPNTAALGASYRALQGLASHRQGLKDKVLPLGQILPDSSRKLKLMAEPKAGDARVYDQLLKRYASLEARVLSVLPVAK